ncbi:MAG: hypothetical protein QNJ47_22050 [Nostocaceae cyanobacterium]|nr:hypothetical protein [Nostocaceae cyanobacterium]
MFQKQLQPQSAPESEESANLRRTARSKRVQKIIRFLGLSGTGIGVPGTIHFLMVGNWKAALAAGMLTIAVTILAIAYKFVSGVGS